MAIMEESDDDQEDKESSKSHVQNAEGNYIDHDDD
jgi:hypothetical protein